MKASAKRKRGRIGASAHRRVAGVLTPAALEERLARGVDVEHAVLGGEMGEHWHVGQLGFDARAHAAGLGEAVGNRVLHALRGEVQAMQRAVLRNCLVRADDN